MNEIDRVIHGDCLTVLPTLLPGTVDLAIVDPPYNIGYDYGDEYNDKLAVADYLDFSQRWLSLVYRALSSNGAFWLVIGDEMVADLRIMCRDLGFHLRSWIVWHYTFGVNCTSNFTRSHAHILYFVKNRKSFVFNADQVRVPSARQLVYNDKRANPEGRLPDDTWVLRPQSSEAFGAGTDSWYISRVCGTFKERVPGAANQLPEQLVGRIVRACSNENQTVLDCMAGTGTVPVVAKKLGRHYIGVEKSSKFAKLASARLDAVTVGDALDGPIPHGD